MALTKKEKDRAVKELNAYIAARLENIERECHRRGLRSIVNFTLIARDPVNDDMSIVVTNESVTSLLDAFRVGAKLQGDSQ